MLSSNVNNMFCNNTSNTLGIKIHLLLIIVIAGATYFMYQLYNECKDLERELIIAKKQIALLSSQAKEHEDTVLVCEAVHSPHPKPIKVKKVKDDQPLASDEEDDEELIDIDEGASEVPSEVITSVVNKIQESASDDGEEVATEGSEEDTEDVDDENEDEDEDETPVPSSPPLAPTPIAPKYQKSKLQTMKISELKDIMKSNGQQGVSGTKLELITRILALKD